MEETELQDDGLSEDRRQAMELLCRELLNAVREENRNCGIWESRTGRRTRQLEYARIFDAVLGRLKWIVLISVLTAVLFGVLAFYVLKPVYCATSKLYIMGESSNSVLSDLQAGTYLAMDYQEVFRTWEVHDMVRQTLGLDYSCHQMQSMLKVTNPSNTRVLCISVTSPNPGEAMAMANAYAEAARQFIAETMDSQAPSTFSMALLPDKASGLDRKSYVVIGFLLGMLVSAAGVGLQAVLDNHPRTPEDILQFADIPTLAIIPSAEPKGKRRSPYQAGDRHEFN